MRDLRLEILVEPHNKQIRRNSLEIEVNQMFEVTGGKREDAIRNKIKRRQCI